MPTKLPRLAPRIALPLALLLPLTGCPPTDNSGDGNLPAGKALVPFDSESQFVSYFNAQYTNTQRQGQVYDSFLTPTVSTLNEGAIPAVAGADGSSFTTTNVQETGVDEADTIETDGGRFYVVSGSALRIIEIGADGALTEVGRWDGDLPLSSIYLTDNKVIALAQSYQSSGGPEILIYPPYYVGSDATVISIDVSDPTAPVETGRIQLDGNLVNSRLANGRLILILSIVPDFQPTGFLPALATSAGQISPTVRVGDNVSTMVSWEHWLRPEDPNGWYSTAIVTLDAADVTHMMHSTAVIASAGTIYASQDALYLSDTSYTPGGTLRETTNIHKFVFSDDGEALYVGSGQVQGRLLNQYSLGEANGALRLATHVSPPLILIDGGDGTVGVSTGVDQPPPDSSAGSAQSVDLSTVASNAVYVLKQGDGELVVSGKIEGIAPNETLYSARFLGDRGYLVTYRQIDPLFTLDLSNPDAPVIAGELKVPGFSDYLHPLSENLLLGVGRATTTNQFGGTITNGVQLSLFDVTDPANPVAIQQLTLGGPGSEADVSYDPKAFALLADQGLLALPMQLLADDGTYTTAFDGVRFFHVDESGFSELGALTNVVPVPGDPRFFYYTLQWRRAAINGDFGFALTPGGVRSVRLSDFSQTHEVTLDE